MVLTTHEICIPEQQHHSSETSWNKWLHHPKFHTLATCAEYMWRDLLAIKDEGDMWCLEPNRQFLQCALQMHWSNSEIQQGQLSSWQTWKEIGNTLRLGPCFLNLTIHPAQSESLMGTDESILGAGSHDMKASHELQEMQVFERRCRARERECVWKKITFSHNYCWLIVDYTFL